jgi:hypothetical protein
MSQNSIPEQIKRWANEVITQFNEDVIRDPNLYYLARYKGRYLYLDRLGCGRHGHIARLAYTGDADAWEFAIYKYSDERYDAEEWLFPGSEYVDGTLTGAMQAGLEAYP